MRLILLLMAPLLVAATVAPTPPPKLQAHGKFADHSGQLAKNCRGRIETARQERGLPKLDSGKDASADPLLILAVDRWIDGCEVLVTNNGNLPLPEFSDTARMHRAH